MRLFLFLITMLLANTALATPYTDSILFLLNKKYNNSEERANQLLTICNTIVRTKANESLVLTTFGIGQSIKLSDSLLVAQFQRLKGVAFATLGNRDSAAAQYYQALAILEQKKDLELLGAVYNDLARFYRKATPERALTFYSKAMDCFAALNNEEEIATIWNESGVAYEYLGNLDEAIKRYNASLAIREKYDDAVGKGYSLEFLSGAYLQKGAFAKSEAYLLQALAIRKATKDTFALSINYNNLGALYKALQQPEKAISYLQQSVALAQQLKVTDLIAHNYKELADVQKQMGNHKEAFDNLQQYYVLKDSMFAMEKDKQIEALNIQYETEKSKLLIKEQSFIIAKRNWGMIILFLVCLAVLLIVVGRYRQHKMKQQALYQQALLQQQDEATKAILHAEEEERARIARDLHDGVGQLMSAAKMNLSAFIHQTEAEANLTHSASLQKVLHLVDDSCKEIRSVSHNMMPNALLKNSLAAAVREFVDKLDYLALEVHLYTEGLDKRIDSNIETVFYRIIQECVQNVIKHSGANRLDISIIKDNEGITATIEDNGKGFVTEQAMAADGVGLKNISSRIQYLKGTVDFDTYPGKGTLVAIFIPIA